MTWDVAPPAAAIRTQWTLEGLLACVRGQMLLHLEETSEVETTALPGAREGLGGLRVQGRRGISEGWHSLEGQKL